MMMKIVTIYDVKTEAYLQPMFFQSLAQAERSFEDVCNDKTHAIGQHPEDYSMVLVGEWDEILGQLQTVKAKLTFAEGMQMVKQKEYLR